MPQGTKSTRMSTAKGQKFAQYVKARFEYLECLSKAGGAGAAPRLVQACEDTVFSITKQLAALTSVDTETAISVINMIQSGRLNGPQQAACTDAINAKHIAQDSSAIADDRKQVHKHFHEYIQREHKTSHAFLPGVDTHSRFRWFAKLARSIGLNYPDEATKARITACAFRDCAHNEEHLLGGPLGYQCLQQFKEAFEAEPVVLSGREPTMFPPYEEFEVKHPRHYNMAFFAPGVNTPSFSPEQIAKVVRIGATIPQRNTSSRLGVASLATPQRGVSRLLDRAFNIGQIALPGFQYFGTDRASCLASQQGLPPLTPPLQGGLQQPNMLALQWQPPTLPSALAPSPGTAVPFAPGPTSPPELALPGNAGGQAPAPPGTVATMIEKMKEARGLGPKARQPKKKGARGATSAKAKRAVKGKPGAKIKTNIAGPQKRKATKPRSVHVEASVSHVLARNGKNTKPSSKAFPYTCAKEIPKAKAAAEKWLKKMGA